MASRARLACCCAAVAVALGRPRPCGGVGRLRGASRGPDAHASARAPRLPRPPPPVARRWRKGGRRKRGARQGGEGVNRCVALLRRTRCGEVFGLLQGGAARPRQEAFSRHTLHLCAFPSLLHLTRGHAASSPPWSWWLGAGAGLPSGDWDGAEYKSIAADWSMLHLWTPGDGWGGALAAK